MSKVAVKSLADQVLIYQSLIKDLDEMPSKYPARRKSCLLIIENQQRLIDEMDKTWNKRDVLRLEWEDKLSKALDLQAENKKAKKLGLTTAQLRSITKKRDKILAELDILPEYQAKPIVKLLDSEVVPIKFGVADYDEIDRLKLAQELSSENEIDES